MKAVVALKDKFVARVKKFKEERLKEQIWQSVIKMVFMVGAFAASKESRDGFTLVEMVQSYQDIQDKLDALENGERDPKSGMRIVPPKNQTGRAFVMALPGMEEMPPGDFNVMWTSWNATLDKLGENVKFVMAKEQVRGWPPC